MTRKQGLVSTDRYKGHTVFAGEGLSPLNPKILDQTYDQIDAFLSHHKDGFLIRVDLKLPKGVSNVEGSEHIRAFFSALTEHLKKPKRLNRDPKTKGSRKYRRTHQHVAYQWVAEVGNEGRLHWHAWVLVDKHINQMAGFSRMVKNKDTGKNELREQEGLLGLIGEYWHRISGGGSIYSKSPSGQLTSKGGYHISVGDSLADRADMDFHLSYMAKVKGKNEMPFKRSHSASRIKYKTVG